MQGPRLPPPRSCLLPLRRPPPPPTPTPISLRRLRPPGESPLPPRPARGPLEVLSGGPHPHVPTHPCLRTSRAPPPVLTRGGLCPHPGSSLPPRSLQPRAVLAGSQGLGHGPRLPDASSDKTGGISAPKTAALSCLLLRNSKLILQSRGGGKGFVWGRRGRAGPADAGDQGWCGRLGRAWKPGGGDLSGPWG